MSLGAWVQRVPSGEDRTETLAVQLQVRNLRDVIQLNFTKQLILKKIILGYICLQADDTSLSGIEVSQVALLSNRWHLRSDQSTIPGAIITELV